jgi:hypothetical protein
VNQDRAIVDWRPAFGVNQPPGSDELEFANGWHLLALPG